MSVDKGMKIVDIDENDPIASTKQLQEPEGYNRRDRACGSESCCFTGDKEYVSGLEADNKRLNAEVKQLNIELAVMLEQDKDACTAMNPEYLPDHLG